jgi:hypothetical protein
MPEGIPFPKTVIHAIAQIAFVTVLFFPVTPHFSLSRSGADRSRYGLSESRQMLKADA